MLVFMIHAGNYDARWYLWSLIKTNSIIFIYFIFLGHFKMFFLSLLHILTSVYIINIIVMDLRFMSVFVIHAGIYTSCWYLHFMLVFTTHAGIYDSCWYL